MSQIFGKILFIDDKFDATVQKAILALVEAKMSVQYWDSKGDFPSTITNVRVIVIDLDLANIGTKTKDASFYFSIAEVLHRVPGPFFVIIMAREYDDDDPATLRKYYKDFYPTSPLCGVILDQGLKKDEELQDPSKLVKLITDSIKQEKTLRLILTWEAVVEKAQDRAFSDLVSSEVEDTISHLIKSICRDFGKESTSREFVDTLTQLISRRLYESPEFKELDSIIEDIISEQIESKEYPRDEDLLFYNKIMYYKPAVGEAIWTGDIYRTQGLQETQQYAIVLTPVCDLVNNEKPIVLACMGFPLDEKGFSDAKYPLYYLDPAAMKKVKNAGGDVSKIPNFLQDRYMKGKTRVPDNFYLLWNFSDEGKTFGICFDFNNVKTLSREEINKNKWPRVLRLDWPFIQDVLEKYGKYVSRVGIPEINMSKEKLKEKFEEDNPTSSGAGKVQK